MRVLITGGCGFIGSNLASYHINKGDEVYVVDNLSTGSLDNIQHLRNHPNFTFVQADITDWPNINEAIQWSERIYHMAAVLGLFRVVDNPIQTLTENILGCECVLEAVKQYNPNSRVMIASTSSVYGLNNKDECVETDDFVIAPTTHPLSGYSIGKIADEILAYNYYQAYGIPTTIARLFNTIGMNQTGKYGMVVPRFIQQACVNEPITVFGDGTQTRSFCDVRDTVTALDLLASNAKAVGQIVNVGNNREISMNDLALLIQCRASSQSEICHVDYEQAYGVPLKDVRNRKPNLDKLKALTGFRHCWVLEQTIDDLVQIERHKHVAKLESKAVSNG